jgi:hypothetical protein
MWTGEIELYVDGKSVISVSGLILRDQEGADARIKGLHFETFFGGTATSALSPCLSSISNAVLAGHTPDWASPKDQKAWFADISAAIID